MAGVNKVILVGNLGADPEARSLNNGGEVVNMRVATSENWKDKDGNRQEKTEWHNVVIFNENLGRVAKSYLRKGSKVYLEGQIQTRKWQDQTGNDRYTTEIVINRFRGELVLLDSREGAGGGRSDFGGGEDFGGGGAPARNRAPSRRHSTPTSTTTFRSKAIATLLSPFVIPAKAGIPASFPGYEAMAFAGRITTARTSPCAEAGFTSWLTDTEAPSTSASRRISPLAPGLIARVEDRSFALAMA